MAPFPAASAHYRHGQMDWHVVCAVCLIDHSIYLTISPINISKDTLYIVFFDDIGLFRVIYLHEIGGYPNEKYPHGPDKRPSENNPPIRPLWRARFGEKTALSIETTAMFIIFTITTSCQIMVLLVLFHNPRFPESL